MVRYSKGSTSPEIKVKQQRIKRTIAEKARLLNKAIADKQLPDTLKLNKFGKVNYENVCAWECRKLGIVKYSANTGNKPENSANTALLKKSIVDLNTAIETGVFKKIPDKQEANAKKYKTRSDLEMEIRRLKRDNQDLINLASELYRSYSQIKAIIANQRINNLSYQEALKKQAEILSNNRLRIVK